MREKTTKRDQHPSRRPIVWRSHLLARPHRVESDEVEDTTSRSMSWTRTDRDFLLYHGADKAARAVPVKVVVSEM